MLLDGYVSTAANAAAARWEPRRARPTAWSATAAPSPATGACSTVSGIAPLLDLGLRLGEGSGAMAAVPLVRMACAAVVEVPTFGEWFG